MPVTSEDLDKAKLVNRMGRGFMTPSLWTALLAFGAWVLWTKDHPWLAGLSALLAIGAARAAIIHKTADYQLEKSLAEHYASERDGRPT